MVCVKRIWVGCFWAFGVLTAMICRSDSVDAFGGEYISQVGYLISGGIVPATGDQTKLKYVQDHYVYLTTDDRESWDKKQLSLILKLNVPSWIEDYEVHIDHIVEQLNGTKNLGGVFKMRPEDGMGVNASAPHMGLRRTTTSPITCNAKFRVRRNYGEHARSFVVTVVDSAYYSQYDYEALEAKYHKTAIPFVVTQEGYGFKVDCEKSGVDYVVTGMHTGEGDDIDDDAVLTIPSGVTKIAESSFTKCEFPAVKVVFPRQLQTIGNRAFSGCTSLAAVDFTDSGKNRLAIGDYAFEGCVGLTSVYFPACVASVGKGAFANCTNLKEFKVDALNSMTLSVRNGLLCDVLGCKILACPSALTSVTIPSSVTGIETDAFKGCQLESVSVSPDDRDRIIKLMKDSGFLVNGVRFNGEEYFEDGSHAVKVGNYTWYFSVSEGVSTIESPGGGKSAIEPSPNGKITIPSALGGHPVVGIDDYALQKDWNDEANWHLTEVEFPVSISYIGQHAFEACNELSKITIPEESRIS